MSKGNCIVNFRVDPELFGAIQSEVAKTGKTDSALSVSDWIRLAICEKIDHAERGRVNRSSVTWVQKFWGKWWHGIR